MPPNANGAEVMPNVCKGAEPTPAPAVVAAAPNVNLAVGPASAGVPDEAPNVKPGFPDFAPAWAAVDDSAAGAATLFPNGAAAAPNVNAGVDVGAAAGVVLLTGGAAAALAT